MFEPSPAFCVYMRMGSTPTALARDRVRLTRPLSGPLAIEQLGEVLWDFPGMFSTSKTGFCCCSLIPFEISVPEGSASVTSLPHRINPIVAKYVYATINQYLAARPLVVIPKTSGGVGSTVNNHKKLNETSKLNQLPIPRVD